MKIYRDRKRAGDYFRLVFYLSGKRYRLNFNSLDTAKKEAAAKAAQFARGDLEAVQLTGKDRLTYGRALDAIRPLGVPLDAAVTEYAQAAKTVAGHSLLDAANFYMRHHANGVAGRMVSDAIEDFRQAKRGAGRSSVYLKEIRYRLGSFARGFSIEVRQLVPQDVAEYLEGLKLHPRSFKEADPLRCPKCSREVRIVSLIDEEDVIERILRHLGLWQEGVRVHSGTDPPGETTLDPWLDDPFPDYDTEPVVAFSAT